MAERPRQALPFGAGLDRESGSLIVDPQQASDIRNVHLTRGRAILRKGLSRVAYVLSEGNASILAIMPTSAVGHVAVVVYHPSVRQVWLHLVESSGASSVVVGFLWGIPDGATTPPRVLTAEAYNTIILAHDEPVYAYRQPTLTFDVRTHQTDILRAELAGPAGDQNIYFRGVARWLNYVVGWGFGADNDEDRPEVFRISMPGEPTNFVAEHYFLVGVRGDPIIGGGGAGNVFKIQKTGETHDLVGYDRATFGVRPGDGNFGLIASRAHVSVESEYFFWSIAGPRVCSGAGASSDLELPLDLDGPVPDALASATDRGYGFAYHDSVEGEIAFVFGRWAYVLHMKDDGRRWSYRQFGVEVASAGRVFAGGEVPSVAIPGEPDANGGALLDPTTYLWPDFHPRLTVNWLNTAAVSADTKVEVWARSQRIGTYNTWRRYAIAAASALTVPTETYPNRSLHDFLADHDVALRYTRYGTPDAGYTSLDPATWPAISRQVQRTGGTIVTFTLGAWVVSGANHYAPLTYVGVGSHRGSSLYAENDELDFVLEKQINGGAWQAHITVDGGQFPAGVTLAGLVSGNSVKIRLKVVGPSTETAFTESAAQVVP